MVLFRQQTMTRIGNGSAHQHWSTWYGRSANQGHESNTPCAHVRTHDGITRHYTVCRYLHTDVGNFFGGSSFCLFETSLPRIGILDGRGRTKQIWVTYRLKDGMIIRYSRPERLWLALTRATAQSWSRIVKANIPPPTLPLDNSASRQMPYSFCKCIFGGGLSRLCSHERWTYLRWLMPYFCWCFVLNRRIFLKTRIIEYW